MKKQEIIKYVRHYIEQDQTHSAIMLSADWGTGKSHFIQHDLIPHLALDKDDQFKDKEKKHNCIVVSLYGLTQLSDISKSIYLEVRTSKIKKWVSAISNKIPKRLRIASQEVISIGSGIGKTILKGVAGHSGVDLNISDKDLKKIFKSIDLSGKLLIFDDIERTKINILEFLGYVNSLVEQDGIKVLLVTNEAEIFQFQSENVVQSTEGQPNLAEKYRKIKEKTISDTIQFEGDNFEAIKQIIRSFNSETLQAFAEDKYIKEIMRLMEEQKCYNLRSLIFACQKAKDIYEFSDKLDLEDKEFSKCIFFGIIAFSLKLKSGNQEAWEEDDNLYSKDLGANSYPLFNFCYNYIVNHTEATKEDIIKAREGYQELLKLQDKDVLVVRYYTNYYEKDVKGAVLSIEKRLENPLEISFRHYGVLAAYLIPIGHLLNIDISNIKKRLVENLRGKCNEIAEGEIFFISSENYPSEVRDEFEKLKKEMTAALKYIALEPVFNYLPEQLEEFKEYIYQNKTHFYSEGAFASKFDIPRMIELFMKCSPEQMASIRQVFASLYDIDMISFFLSRDKDALEQLRKGVEKIQEKDVDHIQALHCKWFAQDIDRYLENLT